MPTLRLIKAPGIDAPGEPVVLKPLETIMGREDKCGIVVPNHAVSRQHAKIIYMDGAYYVEDLKSRNKTFVNNREITEKHKLVHDDRIKICDFQYLYQDDKPGKVVQKIPADFRPIYNPDETADPESVNETSNIESSLAASRDTDFAKIQESEKLQALLNISVSLSRVSELDDVLKTIVDTSFQVFRQADRCFIILGDDAKLIPKIQKARRGNSDDHRFSKTIVRRCMNTKEAYLSEDASSDTSMGAAQSISDFKIRSVMCVPLLGSDGNSIGAMQLDTQDRSKKFKEGDLRLLLIMSNLASLALEKATLQESKSAREKQQKEIEIAQKVQLGFLPQVLPSVPGYEFFGTYSAAQTIGGDYYDMIKLLDGRIAVLLGDVAGKGVPAALLMAKLSAEARFYMLTEPDKAVAVRLLSDSLIRGGIGHRFVTLAAMILDPATHKITLVNAGHLNPMRYRLRDKSLVEVITNDECGPPMAICEDYPYTAIELTLEEGDILFTFTDGVTDSASPTGEMFDFAGVNNTVLKESPLGPITRPKVLGERLMHNVRKHANGTPQSDDIAIVAFGRLTPEEAAKNPDSSDSSGGVRSTKEYTG